MKYTLPVLLLMFLISSFSCNKDDPPEGGNERVYYKTTEFVMGVDLSYLNEVLDHSGIFRDSGMVEDPYTIFDQYGANVARFRLFHNPEWTSQQYGGGQMYQDYDDVLEAIRRSKEEGMEVCLDFHYSDTWADPGKQIIPAAWESLSLEELHDSLYNYTFRVLSDLDDEGLMPEYVQVGNEINPGFVVPQGQRWNNNASNLVYLLNSAIKAVRDVGAQSDIDPRIIIHIAQPENVAGWFDGLQNEGLTDYDIIGFSYYYMWSSVTLNEVSDYVSSFRQISGKDVMIMETAYPWTTENDDNYGNIISVDKLLIPGYPATEKGQYKYLVALTREVIEGGGKGLFYWEPGWISCNLVSQWGRGSAWDCNTFFDFNGEVISAMDFMTYKYEFQ